MEQSRIDREMAEASRKHEEEKAEKKRRKKEKRLSRQQEEQDQYFLDLTGSLPDDPKGGYRRSTGSTAQYTNDRDMELFGPDV